MTMLLVPSTNSFPAYTETVTLDGITYVLRFYFTIRTNQWNFDISDQNGNLLIGGQAVLPGYPLNWRKAQRLPGPTGIFYVVDETGQQRTPDRQELGDEINIYYQPSGI